ncbi:MAG: hypothetical protein RL117_461 [Verrucomicrobiota bacterium]|jgi:hypothetical protein
MNRILREKSNRLPKKMSPALAPESLPPDTLETIQNGERPKPNQIDKMINENLL